MKSIKIFIFCFMIPFLGFSQKKETKVAMQLSNGSFLGIFSTPAAFYNLTTIDLGLDFQKGNRDLYLYLTYGFDIEDLYRGHYLGVSFEYHFLSNQKKIRPYLGLSILSEIATNYKEGYLESESFMTIDEYSHYPASSSGGSSDYIFNSSAFYYSTPFFGTISLGCDFRLIKGLHLNLSAGYKLKRMNYKYLEWYDDDDYREILEHTPVKSRVFHYLNAEIGLSYSFSFHKKENTQPQ